MRWIVVGAGSAGCVVARRLVDAAHDVVLIEAGPPFDAHSTSPATLDAVAGPDGFALHDSTERVHRGLVATRTREAAPTPYVRGRGVGGSSVVNAMVALRGDGAVYRSWGLDDHVTAAAWDRMLIPEAVADASEFGVIDRALLAAADDARRVPLTRRDGRRVTSAEAYLWPIAGSERLSILADSTVDRIVVDRSAPRSVATGVLLADGTVVDADRVVLCAGAIHSPAILQRSDVVVDGIGDGLQDHPSAAMTLVLRDPPPESGPRGLITATILERDPIQVLAVNHLGVHAPPGLALLMVALMRPVSRTGTVRVTSADPLTHPDVHFDLLSDPSDVHRLSEGVRTVIGLLGRPPFAELVDDVLVDAVGTPLAALHDDDAIHSWLRSNCADYVHASGTCAMGTVVDLDGRVAGHDHLHVCDASVFPTIPDVNTHLPVTMLAEVLTARWMHRP